MSLVSLVINWPYHFFQTILVGDSGVGKTSLLVQFDQGKFQQGSFSATVGIGFTVSTCFWIEKFHEPMIMITVGKQNCFMGYGILFHELPVVAVLYGSWAWSLQNILAHFTLARLGARLRKFFSVNKVQLRFSVQAWNFWSELQDVHTGGSAQARLGIRAEPRAEPHSKKMPDSIK